MSSDCLHDILPVLSYFAVSVIEKENGSRENAIPALRPILVQPQQQPGIEIASIRV